MKREISLIIVAAVLWGGCGNPTVSLDNTYEPKIVINAIISPHQNVEKIRISRNFLINQTVLANAVILPDAVVSITDLQTNLKYNLVYGDTNIAYYDSTRSLLIDYGKQYQLDVTAAVDGTLLHASAVTTTPNQGFRINKSLSVLDSMSYFAKDLNDSLKMFEILFDRSPNAEFYVLSLTASDADTSTAIYSPVNAFRDLKPKEVLNNFDELKYRHTWLQNLPKDPGVSTLPIRWFNINFYGNYSAIMYVGDKNFRDFFSTYRQIQDLDGNLYEPIFHIIGDGIGVFGSAIVDSASFKVLRPY
jgi:hypothetical protein